MSGHSSSHAARGLTKGFRRLLPGELTFGWLTLAFSLFLFRESYAISGFSGPNSPGGTPLAASGLMVLCSLIVVVQNLRSIRLDAATWRDAAHRFHAEIMPSRPLIGYIAIVFAYMALLEPLGFNVTSFAFLFASFSYLHRPPLSTAFRLSLVSFAIIYVMFQLIFQVTLPTGDWIASALRSIGR
jgi:putative tricarboxylic transport membrane protein